MATSDLLLTGAQLEPNANLTSQVSAVANNSGTLAGTTAGSVKYYQVNLGGIKLFVAYFSGYENDTTTSQTITFPVAYTNAPTVVVGNSTLPALSATATTLTITAPDSTTTYTGTVLIVGV